MDCCYPYQGNLPQVPESCFIAPGAFLVGRVRLGEGTSVWYQTVLRGDVNFIKTGRYCNLQDGTVVHVDSGRGTGQEGGLPTRLGDYVTVGHRCVLHACTVEDLCLIGMGAVVLDGAVIGKGSVVGAGAVILKGTVVPPLSVVAGVPARVIKTLSQGSLKERMDHAMQYYRLALENKNSILSKNAEG